MQQINNIHNKEALYLVPLSKFFIIDYIKRGQSNCTRQWISPKRTAENDMMVKIN